MKKIMPIAVLLLLSAIAIAFPGNKKTVRAAISLELTCTGNRTVKEGEAFTHQLRLLESSKPLANAVIKINDPIGRICTAVTTDSKGEAVWSRPVPAGTKAQLYTIEFFYGDIKSYSAVSVIAAGVIDLASYPLTLGTTQSLPDANRVVGSRGGFSKALQTMDMMLEEAAKLGKAAIDDYLSNPVNIAKTRVMIVSCTAGLLAPGGPAVCKLLAKDMAKGIAISALKLMLKKAVEASNFPAEAKALLNQMIDLGDLRYAVASLKPSEGLSNINAIGAGIDFVKNAFGLLTYRDGKLTGASFPAQVKGTDEVYLMCIYNGSTAVKPVAVSKPVQPAKTIDPGIPAELKRLFFETGSFAAPIWFQLPYESNVARFNDISGHPEVPASSSSFPATTITMYQANDADNINEYLMSFFVQSGYIKIESRTQTTRGIASSSSMTYNFLFYSPEFKTYVKNFDISENYRSVNRPFVSLGSRSLLSVDYKNEYEDAPLGMKRKFYAITFSYKLAGGLPAMPENEKIYKGKAKAFFDPDDGTWKIKGPFDNLGVILGESEYYGVSDFLKTKYQPYKFVYSKSGGSTTNSTTNSGGSAAGSKTDATIPPGSPVTGTVATVVNGNWSGEVTQKGLKKPYAVKATWNPAKNQFIVIVPEYGCNGIWTVESSTDKSMDLREHIVSGRCTDGGLVRLNYISASELELQYFRPGSSKSNVQGILKK